MVFGNQAVFAASPKVGSVPGVVEIREFYDESTDSYIKKKVRVVYVDWDAPLPKREKGIIYERPNKEPVLFPGDFGYTDDLNINEWSLADAGVNLKIPAGILMSYARNANAYIPMLHLTWSTQYQKKSAAGNVKSAVS